MEQLYLSNNLLVIEWGTYFLIGALFILTLYFTQRKKSSPDRVSTLRVAMWAREKVDLSFIIPSAIVFLISIFIGMLLYRNQRTPTLEHVLPTLLIILPAIILVITFCYLSKKGANK